MNAEKGEINAKSAIGGGLKGRVSVVHTLTHTHYTRTRSNCQSLLVTRFRSSTRHRGRPNTLTGAGNFPFVTHTSTVLSDTLKA